MPSADMLVLLTIALINSGTSLGIAVLGWRMHQNIQKIEVNSNSMREALVESTAKAEFSAGREEARLEGEKTAAALAEGQLASNSEKKMP
jgi:hypothetical protein